MMTFTSRESKDFPAVYEKIKEEKIDLVFFLCTPTEKPNPPPDWNTHHKSKRLLDIKTSLQKLLVQVFEIFYSKSYQGPYNEVAQFRSEIETYNLIFGSTPEKNISNG